MMPIPALPESRCADPGLLDEPAQSLRVGPSYRYIHESISGDSLTLHSVGVNWAIAGYF